MVTIANQWAGVPVDVRFGAPGAWASDDYEIITTPTTGNWLVAVVAWKMIDGSTPVVSVGDWSRNLWTLAYTNVAFATADNTADQLHVQVWVAPAVQYAGWPALGVYVAFSAITTYDVGTPVVSVIELAGMGNGALTVDSVTSATAHATTSVSLTVPAPATQCMMVAGAAIDATAAITVSGAGWTALTAVTSTGSLPTAGPNAGVTPAWQVSSASQALTATTVAAHNWAMIAVAFRVSGIVPVQQAPAGMPILSNMPVTQWQLGLGYGVSTPPGAIYWTDLSFRYLGMQGVRGIPYELDQAQASETTFDLGNKDGALTPRTPGTATATSVGTTTTLVATGAAGINIGDYFRLQNSTGILKELSVFQVTGIAGSTYTYARADGTGGGSIAATAIGDVYIGCPIDVYVPVRVLATYGGRTNAVLTDYMERWPQTWTLRNYGHSPAVGIDALATLIAADLTPLRGEILRRDPSHYWTLSDAQGATSAQNISGTSTTTLVPTVSKYGAGSGTAAFGASTQNIATGVGSVPSLLGDPGSAWQQISLVATDIVTHGSALIGNGTDFPSITNGVTIYGALAGNVTDATIGGTGDTVDPTVMIIRNTDPGQGVSAGSIIKIAINHTATNKYNAVVTVWDKTSHTATSTTDTTANQLVFGGWNSWALRFNQTSWAFFTQGKITMSGTCNLTSAFTEISVGGEADAFSNGRAFNAAHAHVAVFPRQLSTGELTAVHFAMQNGSLSNNTNVGTAGSIAAKLDTADWQGARVLNSSDLSPVLDNVSASTVADKINLYAGYEDGLLFADAAGQLQFRGRVRSYYQTARAVLGDGPGEFPYLDDITYDFDLTYLYNSVQVANLAYGWGSQAQVTTNFVAADTTGSVPRYGLRSLARDTHLLLNEDAFSLAWWLLGRFAYPKLRVEVVTLEPASNPALWAFALSVEVGDLVTLNRRPTFAPMMTSQCRVLQVEQDNTSAGVWQTKLALGIAPGAPGGILTTNDPVLGIVGSNVLGA